MRTSPSQPFRFVLLTPRLSRVCVPAWLQASLLGFFSRGRFQLKEFSISKPGDGPEHHDERDVAVFDHVTSANRNSMRLI